MGGIPACMVPANHQLRKSGVIAVVVWSLGPELPPARVAIAIFSTSRTSTMATAPVRVHYFPIRGRAEVLRLLLADIGARSFARAQLALPLVLACVWRLAFSPKVPPAHGAQAQSGRT